MSRISPILFNTEMVQAVLDDRKKTTRRIIKPSQYIISKFNKRQPAEVLALKSKTNEPWISMTDAEFIAASYKPRYNPGDILYVRETWDFAECITCDGRYNRSQAMNCYDLQAVEYDDGNSISDGCFIYKADCKDSGRIIWRPSIHMPKQAARIWLKVNNVYVQHIDDMTLDDFLKEGVVIRPEAFNDPENAYLQAKEEFQRIWESTLKGHDKECYMWDENPWIWAIEFERCRNPHNVYWTE